jgi:hypothetical protein
MLWLDNIWWAELIKWWTQFLIDYSVSIGLIVWLLKKWAVINPNVPSDKIIDLFKFKK